MTRKRKPKPDAVVPPLGPSRAPVKPAVQSTSSERGSHALGPVPAAARTSPEPETARKWGCRQAITRWAAVGTIFLNTVALILSTYWNSSSLSALENQIRLQEKAIEETRPIDFLIEAEIAPRGDLRIRMKNDGPGELRDVSAQFKYYFAIRDGRVLSRQQLESMLSDDPALLNAAKEGLLDDPGDVRVLLGAARAFSMRKLDGSDTRDVFEPELSQSSVQNALRLAALVNGKAIMRWRVDYQHRTSRRRFTNILVLILDNDQVPSLLEARVTSALDLAAVVGGPALIDAIRVHDASSMETIFPTSNGPTESLTTR